MVIYFETEIQTGRLSFLGSVRYYGIQFDNPHSRGFADAADASSKDKTVILMKPDSWLKFDTNRIDSFGFVSIVTSGDIHLQLKPMRKTT